MKKLIGTVAALLLVASAAFAELSVGAWLRTVYVPINSDGDETIYGGMANSWADGPRWSRLDFAMTSEDGKAGLQIGLYDENGGMGFGDNYRIWVKPIDMLTVSFGAKDNGDFLAALCYGSWDWVRPNNAVAWGEDIAFGKVCNQAGLLLELEPIENLLISWNLPYSSIASAEAYKAFEKQHIGVRYAIEGIGTIKAAWKGNGGRYHEQNGYAAGYYKKGNYKDGSKSLADLIVGGNSSGLTFTDADGDTYTYKAEQKAAGDEYKYLGDIGVAFELSAVENLNVVVGAQIAIASSDYKDKYALDENNKDNPLFRNAKFGLGASYAITDAFTVFGDFGMGFYDGDDVDPVMNFGVGANYALMDALTLNVDFRGLIPNNDMDPSFSFLVGVDYACSTNGSIGIGFAGLIAGETAGMGKKAFWNPVFQAKQDKFSFAVPIKVAVSF